MPKQKNIYTITVTNKSHGFIAHIETHSNKKKAEARLSRLTELWVTEWMEKHGTTYREYEVELHITKLQRKSHWE